MENSVSPTNSTKTDDDTVRDNENSSLTGVENNEILSDSEKEATNKKSTKKGAARKTPAKTTSRRPSRNVASKAAAQNDVKDVTPSDIEDGVEKPVKRSRKGKVASKDDVTSSKSSEVEDAAENGTAPAPVKPSRKRKTASKDEAKPSKATEVGDDVETETIQEQSKPSRKRKVETKSSQQKEAVRVSASIESNVDGDVDKSQPWTLLVHKKLKPGWVAYNPAKTRKPSPPEGYLKLISWNVNGLRALLKVKGVNPVLNFAQNENFDVLCLQETKLQEKDVGQIKDSLLPGYDHSFWSCSQTKLGYSGTAIISRIKPISVKYGLGSSNHDDEGRLITLEFEKFYLVAGYIPNAGQKLERLTYRTQDWDLCLANYIKDLEKSKPVVLTGDLNCAYQEIDIYNPDGNRRSAGFTDEERTSFEENFLKRGLFDTFRKQHPNSVAYTYWGYRTAARPKNQGWRLDYFLVSDILDELIYDSYTCPDVGGSDHCPIGLILKA